MLDTSPYTDEQWWAMCDVDMPLPIPLAKADLTRPFVYERGRGVFYVAPGRHQVAMSLLLAFQHGKVRGVEVANLLGVDFSSGTADFWLEHTPGAAFRSSVSSLVHAARPASLTAIERRAFGAVRYVFSRAPEE